MSVKGTQIEKYELDNQNPFWVPAIHWDISDQKTSILISLAAVSSRPSPGRASFSATIPPPRGAMVRGIVSPHAFASRHKTN